jgi:peptidoglycan hydrolase CwlO-like protein
MLSQVAWDMKGFVIILFIVILAFASSFYLLDSFDSPSASVFSALTVMLGEFYLDEEVDPPFDQVVPKLFFVAYVVLVMVLMLNLLIAIISDTFERVVERQNAQFWKQLASLILDTEQLFGWAVNRVFSRERCLWLHVLEPVNAAESADESWSGRVRQLKLHMENSGKKANAKVDDVKAQVDGVKAQVDGVKAQFDDVNAKVDGVKAQVDGVNAKVDGVNAKVDEILKLLANQQ